MKVKLWLCKEEEKYHMLFDVQKKPRRNLLGFDRPATSYSTEEVGGILELVFDEEGNLLFRTDADENDLLYDDIACGMLIKKMQYEKRELLESLEMFYRVFFLGEDGQ